MQNNQIIHSSLCASVLAASLAFSPVFAQSQLIILEANPTFEELSTALHGRPKPEALNNLETIINPQNGQRIDRSFPRPSAPSQKSAPIRTSKTVRLQVRSKPSVPMLSTATTAPDDGGWRWITAPFPFISGSSDLMQAALPTLQGYAMLMAENPQLIFTISGHTDAYGTDAYNDELSRKRATSVRNWLIANGVQPERLRLRWRGEREHVAGYLPTDSVNRRVQLGVRTSDLPPEDGVKKSSPGPWPSHMQDNLPNAPTGTDGKGNATDIAITTNTEGPRKAGCWRGIGKDLRSCEED